LATRKINVIVDSDWFIISMSSEEDLKKEPLVAQATQGVTASDELLAMRKNSNKSKNTVPATIPTVDVAEDGVEWITFSYSVKGMSREYRIRTDIDGIEIPDIPQDFKVANCVYPRAFCEKSQYTGNRWDYETAVNELGWRLTYLNPDELSGKRGLIQRAVDSYRNRFPEMRSRRVMRQEKLVKGTLRRRSDRPSSLNYDSDSDSEDMMPSPKKPKRPPPQTSPVVSSRSPRVARNSPHVPAKRNVPLEPQDPILTFDIIVRGNPVPVRIRTDIDTVSLDQLPQDFKHLNAVFPRANASTDTLGKTRIQEERTLNELGWKLCWLNPKLNGKKGLLQRALDAYRSKFSPMSLKPRRGKRAVEEVTARLLHHQQQFHQKYMTPSPYMSLGYHHRKMLDEEEDDETTSNGLSAAELLRNLVDGRL
jgi:hypothetical protein